jgi:hypothetical protein
MKHEESVRVCFSYQPKCDTARELKLNIEAGSNPLTDEHVIMHSKLPLVKLVNSSMALSILNAQLLAHLPFNYGLLLGATHVHSKTSGPDNQFC